MQKKYFFLLIVFFPFLIFSEDFYGYVFQFDNKEPLVFCNVYLMDAKSKKIIKGDLTDETGFYVIKEIPEGDFLLVGELIGFQSETLKVSSRGEKSILRYDFKLKIKSFQSEGSEVTSEKSSFKEEITLSKKIYKREELKINVPLLENDVLRSFQLLPSVISVSDFSANLYVRGGAPDQNLILFDNTPIFNPFHLGGIFSTFEINSIEKASFYAGGFPVDYGNRLSSVIDISSVTPKDTTFHGNINVSMLSSSFYFESKQYKSVSFFISARRTYFDQILKLMGFSFPYYFFDNTFVVNFKMNQKNNLKLTFFMDNDILDIKDDTFSLADVRWGNIMFSLNHSTLLTNDLSFFSNIYYTDFKNSMDLLKHVHLHSYVYQYGGKINFRKNFDEKSFNAGLEIYRDSFDYIFTVSDSEELFNLKNNPYYLSLFLDNNFKKIGLYILNMGVRLDKYEYKKNFVLSLRGSLKYFIDEKSSISFSVGDNYQFITAVKQETNDFSSIFGETWLPLMENFEPLRCINYILGFESFFQNNTSLNVEIYHKDYKNLVYTTLFDLYLNLENSESSFKITKGYSQGMEILLKKSLGNLKGWVGYSLSRTYILKDSIYYPTYYDRTHSFNLSLSYSFKNGIILNCVINYGTGLPYTAVIGKYIDYTYDPILDDYYKKGWKEIYSDYNGVRFPSYKRIDFGVSKKFNFKRLKLGINFNIVNIFNFKNVYFYYYDHSVSPSKREEFYMFPVIPSLGVFCEF